MYDKNNDNIMTYDLTGMIVAVESSNTRGRSTWSLGWGRVTSPCVERERERERERESEREKVHNQ